MAEQAQSQNAILSPLIDIWWHMIPAISGINESIRHWLPCMCKTRKGIATYSTSYSH